jgi:tripartite-type tricarboxylate transporter receptor subunit TctC
MIIADLTTGSAGLNSDRIRTLAVTSLQRSKKHPDVPTPDASGVKGYEVNTWMGFFAPAGTPKEIASIIEAAIKEAVAMPDVRARFETTGAVVRSGSADEMRKVLATDVAKWAKLVHDKNIKLVP